MDIRALVAEERMIGDRLLDGWRLAEGWTAGGRFLQQLEHDPGATRMSSWPLLRAGLLAVRRRCAVYKDSVACDSDRRLEQSLHGSGGPRSWGVM
ncbi:MAG: hypothetical protein CBD18_08320 [Opitutales bacterium TMED158]|nr:MAG: hypothetical protein CBD18_08320 [Opitutales bacterium TMED158]